MKRVCSHPTLLGALVVIALLLVVCAVSYVWVPGNVTQALPADSWAPPSRTHLLGANKLGHDLVSVLMVGSQVTVYAAFGATALAVGLGTAYALALPFLPGWLAFAGRRVIDLATAFPTLVIAVVAATAFSGSTLTALLAIGLGTAPAVARTVVPEVYRAAASDHVMAATAAGARPWWIARRHILPVISSTLLVRATQIMGVAALAEAGLSYLGLGTPAPTPSWGRTLAELQTQLFTRPQYLVVPALVITVVILACNLLGDGLRDVLDPKEVAR